MHGNAPVKIHRKPTLAILLALSSLALAACANVNPYGTSISAQTPVAVGQEEDVTYGSVVSVQRVNLQKQANAGSELAGAAGGAFLGHLLGGGRGNSLATFAGALAGAGLTQRALHHNEPAQRVTVRLDRGRTVAVVEPLSAGRYRPGQRVELVRTQQNHVQVVPLAAAPPPPPPSRPENGAGYGRQGRGD